MSTKELKSKIEETLNLMDEKQLESAWLILKEISKQEQYEQKSIDKALLDKKISTGIKQLDRGEGTDFSQFLNEMEVKYGSKNL